jgi:hypothetical protein
MTMSKKALSFATRHGLHPGDLIQMNGRTFVITAVSATALDLREATWFDRLRWGVRRAHDWLIYQYDVLAAHFRKPMPFFDDED